MTTEPRDLIGDVQDDVARRIRAELVCCDIYARVNDSHELTFREATKSLDWHDLCYWGEASARIAEGRCPGYETVPNICRCKCDGCKHSCGAHEFPRPDIHEPIVSTRFFWSRGWDSPWWLPLILVGIKGGDENCNRTIGLRLPGGALFICLNVPLRQKPCRNCCKQQTVDN